MLLLAAPIAVAATLLPAGQAEAAEDITEQVRAGEDATLSGDAVIRLEDGEEITYGGVFSGVGTLTVGGRGKLVLTADSDFALPSSRQQVEPRGEPWWWNTIVNPDPPAVTVEAGATLQYGDGEGSTGTIGHYPYDLSNYRWNALNHRVDGTLIVAVHGAHYHPGNLSGSGFIVQPRSTWDGLTLAGEHTFSGVLYNGTGVQFSPREARTTMPEVDTVLNQGSFIVNTQEDNDTVLDMDFFSREWGNDINFHSQIFGSKVVVSGVYSWADSGPDSSPSLSDPSLNFQVVPHNHNKRGINIEGAVVQWGDGTHNRFFLPGNRDTIYINMHSRRIRSHLIFNYNGPVTLSAPISGGVFHDTLDDVGQGDVTIAGTEGNDVTFADRQNYDGATTVESGAVLRLGDGEEGGDGDLLTGAEHTQIVVNGALVVSNVDTDIELSRISGSGRLEQAGPATLTLTRDIEHTGPTEISGGTLAVTGGTIARSESVALSGEDAVLTIGEAGDQEVADLSGVPGSVVNLGSNDMTVASHSATEYAGSITGSGAVVKKGSESLTFSSASTTTGPWRVEDGDLTLAGADLAGDLNVAESLTLSGSNTVGGDLVLTDGAALLTDTDAGLTVAGEAALAGSLTVSAPVGSPLPAEIPIVTASKVTGTFAGLDDEAEVSVQGETYRISYAGDSVVLVSAAASAAEPSAHATDDPSPQSPAAPDPQANSSAPLYVAAGLIPLLTLGAWAVVARRRREPGRHRAL